MCTNCAPLFTYLFLYLCITAVDFTFRYIENVFSLYNSEFSDYYYKT